MTCVKEQYSSADEPGFLEFHIGTIWRDYGSSKLGDPFASHPKPTWAAVADFSQVDVALRYGGGVYPAATAERIMNETVSPVCAPSYLDVGGLSGPADPDKCQLIH